MFEWDLVMYATISESMSKIQIVLLSFSEGETLQYIGVGTKAVCFQP